MNPREALLADHSQTIDAVLDAARAVSAGGPFTEGRRLRSTFAEEVYARDLRERLLAALETAADAAGVEVRGAPVTAPPYFCVASRGPLCRGTLAEGGRLVVESVVFAVERDPRRYLFTDLSPETSLSVSIRDKG